jgi:multidrug resistance protein, MATE family
MSDSLEMIKEEHATDLQRTSYGRLLKIALPMVVQGLIFTIMLMADRMFVARYDINYLAAVSTSGGMATALGFFFTGTIGFASNIVAQYYGARREEMLAAPVWAGIFLSLIAAVILVVTLPLTQNIFAIPYFKNSPEFIHSQQVYFRFIVMMHATSLFQISLIAFFIGIGQTFKTMVVAIAGNLVNEFPELGISFPELGIWGAGFASLLGAFTSLAIAVGFFIHAKKDHPYILKPRYEPKIIKRLLGLGAPAGIQMGLEMGGFSLLQMALGSISVATLAASAVSFGLQGFVYAPVVAMASAGAIIIGQERGAMRMHNFKPIIRKVLIITSIYSTGMLFIMWRFPAQLISLYGSDASEPEVLAEVQHIARYFLLITGIWLIPDAFFNTYLQVLKALGDSRFLSLTMIVATALIIVAPALILMRVEQAWAKYAIYSMTIVYVMILWLIFGLRYRGGKWKNNHVID